MSEFFCNSTDSLAFVPEGQRNLAGGKAEGRRPRNGAEKLSHPGGTPEPLRNLPAPLPGCAMVFGTFPGAAARRWLALPPAKFPCPSGAKRGHHATALSAPAF